MSPETPLEIPPNERRVIIPPRPGGEIVFRQMGSNKDLDPEQVHIQKEWVEWTCDVIDKRLGELIRTRIKSNELLDYGAQAYNLLLPLLSVNNFSPEIEVVWGKFKNGSNSPVLGIQLYRSLRENGFLLGYGLPLAINEEVMTDYQSLVEHFFKNVVPTLGLNPRTKTKQLEQIEMGFQVEIGFDHTSREYALLISSSGKQEIYVTFYEKPNHEEYFSHPVRKVVKLSELRGLDGQLKMENTVVDVLKKGSERTTNWKSFVWTIEEIKRVYARNHTPQVVDKLLKLGQK